MSLTLTITLDDSDVERFIEMFNEDAETEITPAMIYQNPDLHIAMTEDMVAFWLDTLEEDASNAYELYSDLIDEVDDQDEIATLDGYPVTRIYDIEDEI